MLEFGCVDWMYEDIGEGRMNQKYGVVRIFGRMENGETVVCDVTNFMPWVYISGTGIGDYVKKNADKWWYKQTNKLNQIKYDIVKRKPLWEYSTRKKEYARVECPSQWTLNQVYKLFNPRTCSERGCTKEPLYGDQPIPSRCTAHRKPNDSKQNTFNVHEKQMPCFMKFMHVKNIDSTGWVTVKNYEYVSNRKVNHHITVDISDIQRLDRLELPPLVIASFDIESVPEDNDTFPDPKKKKDPVTQIGIQFKTLGSNEIVKYLLSYRKCNPIDGVTVMNSKTEAGLLRNFLTVIHKHDPDIFVGHNVFGFDWKYLWYRLFVNLDQFQCQNCNAIATYGYQKPVRCEECRELDHVYFPFDVSRLDKPLDDFMELHNTFEYFYDVSEKRSGKPVKVDETQFGLYKWKSDQFNFGLDVYTLNTSARGDNIFTMWRAPGRVHLDTLTLFQIDHKLDSYSLDNLSSIFLGENKVDMNMQDLFNMWKSRDPEKIREIAVYCVQDINLPQRLLDKCNYIATYMLMALVAKVPVQYILLKGQQIRTYSLIADICNQLGYVLPSGENIANTYVPDDYEGAFVITPLSGFYDEPVFTNDFKSLYPTIMRAYNLCYSMNVVCIKIQSCGDNEPLIYTFRACDKEYNTTVTPVTDRIFKVTFKKDVLYLLRSAPIVEVCLEHHCYEEIVGEDQKCTKHTTKVQKIPYVIGQPNLPGHEEYRDAMTDSWFVQQGPNKHLSREGKDDGPIGILPRILENLMNARQSTKKEMKRELDPFKKGLLDARQLALKVMCNSVYGFTGVKVGRIPHKRIAATTTAMGRRHINDSKVRAELAGFEVIYGDTDSIMVRAGTKNMKEAFEIGERLADADNQCTPKPIELEFEKVYWPYTIIKKKRYYALKFEGYHEYEKYINATPETVEDIFWKLTDYKGIELVRRDNAPIVKHIQKMVVWNVLHNRNPDLAFEKVKEYVQCISEGRVDMKDLITSKKLKGSYKSDNQPHVLLAKKIEKRNPGTGPRIGDRVPFYYKKGLFGQSKSERAEDPVFGMEKMATNPTYRPDVDYYLDQVVNPFVSVYQFFIDINYDLPEVRQYLDRNDTNVLLERARKKHLREVEKGKKYGEFDPSTVEYKDKDAIHFDLSKLTIKALISQEKDNLQAYYIKCYNWWINPEPQYKSYVSAFNKWIKI